MTASERFYRWIENGKQVGKSLTLQRDGRTLYSSVAVQRMGDRQYRVEVDEIDEKLMAAEVFARDESRVFDSIEEAVKFIEEHTPVSISDLTPRKGQRWFR